MERKPGFQLLLALPWALEAEFCDDDELISAELAGFEMLGEGCDNDEPFCWAAGLLAPRLLSPLTLFESLSIPLCCCLSSAAVLTGAGAIDDDWPQ